MSNEKQNPRVVVGVIIYNDSGQIFLARSHKWQDKWIVPGGHLDWGETLEECAKREVKEETNLDVDNIQLIDVQESIFSEEFHKKKHMVFLDFAAKAKNGEVMLNDELQEYKWFNAQEALDIDLNASTREFIEKFNEKDSHV